MSEGDSKHAPQCGAKDGLPCICAASPPMDYTEDMRRDKAAGPNTKPESYEMQDDRRQEAGEREHSVLAHKYNDTAECPACRPTVALLRARAEWYRAGCDGLEDREGYWTSGDLLREVAGDLDAALARLAQVEAERDHEQAGREAAAEQINDLLAGREISNWPCCACGYGHSASIDAGFETELRLRAEAAEQQVAQLTQAARAFSAMRLWVSAYEGIVFDKSRALAAIDACDRALSSLPSTSPQEPR